MWPCPPLYRPRRACAERSFCDHVAVAISMFGRTFAGVVLLLVAVAGCRSAQTVTVPAPTPTISTDVAAVERTQVDARIERYGDLASQFGELWLPATSESRPVVVLVHGGFWQDQFGFRLMDPLAADLAGRGYAVWNIEYRRVGGDGGGWPTTFDDVAAAIDHLSQLAGSYPLDLERVAFVGHSAGGHLALWAAGREAIAEGEPWSNPAIVPDLAVGQAPLVDLATASAERAGGGAVDTFLGGSVAEVPERYAAATPNPPTSGEVLIVLGADDRIVAPQWAGGGAAFESAQVEVVDTDHFDVIDPSHPSWAVVVDAVQRVIGPAG